MAHHTITGIETNLLQAFSLPVWCPAVNPDTAVSGLSCNRPSACEGGCATISSADDFEKNK